jgi:hypothetical protein
MQTQAPNPLILLFNSENLSSYLLLWEGGKSRERKGKDERSAQKTVKMMSEFNLLQLRSQHTLTRVCVAWPNKQHEETNHTYRKGCNTRTQWNRSFAPMRTHVILFFLSAAFLVQHILLLSLSLLSTSCRHPLRRPVLNRDTGWGSCLCGR